MSKKTFSYKLDLKSGISITELSVYTPFPLFSHLECSENNIAASHEEMSLEILDKIIASKKRCDHMWSRGFFCFTYLW